MVKEKIYITDLHFEHKLWDNELAFYKDEIAVFEPHLEELVSKYTDKEVLKGIEHFQNQFLLQKEEIHDLHDAIKAHEHNLATFAKDHPIAIDHYHFSDHRPLREQVERQRAIYSDFKKEFFVFLDRWL